jgi:hypothetical protein
MTTEDILLTLMFACTIPLVVCCGEPSPTVNERTYHEIPIANLVIKQDDDGEAHYSFNGAYGMEIGTDKKIGREIQIRRGDSASATYMTHRYSYRSDPFKADEIRSRREVSTITVPHNYEIQIFND